MAIDVGKISCFFDDWAPQLLRRLGFVAKDAGRGSFFGCTGERGVPVLRVERVDILEILETYEELGITVIDLDDTWEILVGVGRISWELEFIWLGLGLMMAELLYMKTRALLKTMANMFSRLQHALPPDIFHDPHPKTRGSILDLFNLTLCYGKLTVCDIENGPVEIVDLLMKNGGSFHSFLYTRG